MPTINQRFEVEAPREATWAYFVDIPVAAACVPGFQSIESKGEGRYTGKLQVKLGMIQATFGGELEIVELTEPSTLIAKINGKDLKSMSVLTVATRLDLQEAGPRLTVVQFHADVSIMGSLGNFGWGLFEKKANELGEAFAACVRERLRSAAQAQ